MFSWLSASSCSGSAEGPAVPVGLGGNPARQPAPNAARQSSSGSGRAMGRAAEGSGTGNGNGTGSGAAAAAAARSGAARRARAGPGRAPAPVLRFSLPPSHPPRRDGPPGGAERGGTERGGTRPGPPRAVLPTCGGGVGGSPQPAPSPAWGRCSSCLRGKGKENPPVPGGNDTGILGIVRPKQVGVRPRTWGLPGGVQPVFPQKHPHRLPAPSQPEHPTPAVCQGAGGGMESHP